MPYNLPAIHNFITSNFLSKLKQYHSAEPGDNMEIPKWEFAFS